MKRNWGGGCWGINTGKGLTHAIFRAKTFSRTNTPTSLPQLHLIVTRLCRGTDSVDLEMGQSAHPNISSP
jgi:hypothetical protein